MQAQINETPYIFVHRIGTMGSIQNEIAEIVDLNSFRLNKEDFQAPRANELNEQDFSFLLMAQEILGKQRELPEDFIAPLNATMSKVGKKTSSKPRF